MMSVSTLGSAGGVATRLNRSTHAYVVLLGTVIGLAGAAHGLFEILQGNRSTRGKLLREIGAFTLIQNYLATGVAAVVTGLTLSTWTITRIQRRDGPSVFLLLSTLLFLVGGGIAQAPASVMVWAVATRIRSSLSWWERTLPPAARTLMARAWLPTLLTGFGLLLAGVAIWLLVLPPGKRRAVGPLHYLLWSILLCGLVLLVAAIPCGFARDIELRSAIA